MSQKYFGKFTELLQEDTNRSVRRDFVEASVLIFCVPVVFVAIARSSAGQWYKEYFDPNVNMDIFHAMVAVILLHAIVARFVWKAL